MKRYEKEGVEFVLNAQKYDFKKDLDRNIFTKV